VGNELIDLLDQLADVAKGAAADGALGDQGEPALDLIKPAGIGGSEVQVIAGMTGQPGFDLGMFVGGVIVHHQVHVEVGGDVAVQMLEKGQELLMAMAWFALGNHAAIEDVEGREERGGAMAEVVVSDPPRRNPDPKAGSVGCVRAPEPGFFRPHTGPGRGPGD
jgi:hypothetical protein